MSTPMKTTVRVLALFGLIATLGPLTVKAQSRIEFTVPFDFTAGKQTFAAGDYIVSKEVPSHLILIQSAQGQGNAILVGGPDELNKLYGAAMLTFHRFGERYFLAKFSDYGSASALPLTTGEKELIAGRASPKSLNVIASSRR
ncbi:MAG: hypothetical protein ABSH09_31750 [Bryobacteraceae bacterium]